MVQFFFRNSPLKLDEEKSVLSENGGHKGSQCSTKKKWIIFSTALFLAMLLFVISFDIVSVNGKILAVKKTHQADLSNDQSQNAQKLKDMKAKLDAALADIDQVKQAQIELKGTVAANEEKINAFRGLRG